MYRKFLLAGAGTALLGLAGCDQYDPLLRDGLWHPMHVNRSDLTMQAAYPADLVRGSGTHATDGVLAANAIQRLHDDKVKKLPDVSSQTVSQGSSGN